MKGWTTFDMASLRAAYTRMAEPNAHWFSPDTMRFFRSRLDRVAYVGTGGAFFVTSEQYDGCAPRYSVRVWLGRKVDTVGEFQAYATLADAREAAKAAAAEPLFHAKGVVDLGAERGLLQTDEGAFDARASV